MTSARRLKANVRVFCRRMPPTSSCHQALQQSRSCAGQAVFGTSEMTHKQTTTNNHIRLRTDDLSLHPTPRCAPSGPHQARVRLRAMGPSRVTAGTARSLGMQRGGTWPMDRIQATHRGHRRADVGLRRARSPTQKPSLTRRRIRVSATTYDLARVLCNKLRASQVP